ncbi:MAG TPA: ATP-binding protein [Bryobacteraceae bacterium]|jgi:hypothetical protein
MAYDALRESGPGGAVKEYLQILKLAAEEGKAQVDAALRDLLEGKADAVITVGAIGERPARLGSIAPATLVEVAAVDLALAQELVVGRERRMHFTKCSLLMQDLLAAKRDLRLSREIKRLGRYEGLMIDDLGYIQQTRDDMEVVFTLLAERYERGSVLMTSNLAFSKWASVITQNRPYIIT